MRAPPFNVAEHLIKPELADQKIAQMQSALRGARLMLYAWKGSRRRMGLADDHTELTDTIAKIEAALATVE